MTWLDAVRAKREAATLAYMSRLNPHDWSSADMDAAIDLAHAKGIEAIYEMTWRGGCEEDAFMAYAEAPLA